MAKRKVKRLSIHDVRARLFSNEAKQLEAKVEARLVARKAYLEGLAAKVAERKANPPSLLSLIEAVASGKMDAKEAEKTANGDARGLARRNKANRTWPYAKAVMKYKVTSRNHFSLGFARLNWDKLGD